MLSSQINMEDISRNVVEAQPVIEAGVDTVTCGKVVTTQGLRHFSVFSQQPICHLQSSMEGSGGCVSPEPLLCTSVQQEAMREMPRVLGE